MGDNGKGFKQARERLGESKYNNDNELMKIIVYNNATDIVIEFQDKYKARVSTRYSNFKNGSVKNPYHKNKFGGYYGQGKYKTKINEKHTEEYKIWHDMLRRCYDPYFLDKEPSYIGCSVCDEWLNFQNFAKWYEENYYKCNNERMHLDKDIICKGNKIYSPQNCCFVPQRINALFIKRDIDRGEYPLGVCKKPYDNSLLCYCGILDENKKYRRIHLGVFPLNKPFQAFYTYKIFKENYIKQVADEYKDIIPQKLYEALYKYEVEIND